MKIKEFLDETFGTLNVFLDEEGELWFYGVSVAETLGYANPGKTVIDHVKKTDKKVIKRRDYADDMEMLALLWGNPNDKSHKTLISEAGLYKLCFSSKMEKAEEFTDWVTHTVLKSIRKNGGYIQDQEFLSEKDQKELNEAISSLTEKVKYLRKRRKELRSEATKLHDKVKTLKRSKKALDEHCDLLERMYELVLEDYRKLAAPEEDRYQPTRHNKVITDREGMVIDIQSYIA